MERNPITVTADRNKEHLKKDRMLQTRPKQMKTHACIYPGDATHKVMSKGHRCNSKKKYFQQEVRLKLHWRRSQIN